MKFGLEIFDIEPMSYPEVSLVEKEITQLTEIWNIKHEWDKQCGVWKDIKFYDLDIEDMLDVQWISPSNIRLLTKRLEIGTYSCSSKMTLRNSPRPFH